MFAILHALGMFVADLLKSRCRLETENLLLRHQLSIAMRGAPPRLRLRGSDRARLLWITRLWPSLGNRRVKRSPMGRHYDPEIIAAIIALAIVVWLIRHACRRVRAFSRVLAVLS